MLVGSTSAMFLLSRGLRLEHIIVLKAFQAIVIVLVEFPIGYFADRVSRKLSVQISVGCCVLWLGLTAYSPSLRWLYYGEFFNALSIAFLSGAFEAIIIKEYQETHGPQESLENFLGKVKSINFVGIFIAIIASSLFFSTTSSFFWWLGAIVLIMQLVFFSSAIPKHKEEADKKEEGQLPKFSLFINDVKTIWGYCVKEKLFMRFFYMQIFISIYFQFILQYWQPIYEIYLKHFGLEYARVLFGLMFAAITIAQAIAGFVIQKLPRRFEFYRAYGVVFLCSIISMYVGIIYSSFFVIVSLFLAFFSMASFEILLSSSISHVISDTLRASFLSLLSITIRLGIVASALVLPFLLSVYNLTFFAFLGLCLALTVLFMPLDKYRNMLYKTKRARE